MSTKSGQIQFHQEARLLHRARRGVEHHERTCRRHVRRERLDHEARAHKPRGAHPVDGGHRPPPRHGRGRLRRPLPRPLRALRAGDARHGDEGGGPRDEEEDLATRRRAALAREPRNVAAPPVWDGGDAEGRRRGDGHEDVTEGFDPLA